MRVDYGEDVAGYELYEWQLKYFNVPVTVQYKFSNGFHLETGPQIDLLLGAKIKSREDNADIKNDLKGVSFSWGFGTSYLTKSRLGIDVQYILGLSKVNESSINQNSIKNRVFQISLFYLFGKEDRM